MTADQKTGEIRLGRHKGPKGESLKACPLCDSDNVNWIRCDGEGVVYCGDCRVILTKKSLHEAIAAWNRRAERNSGEGWVDASERKPDTGTCPTVLCCSPCWDRPQALIWTGLKWLWDFDGNECSAPVTHWMQMPALPTTAARREG